MERPENHVRRMLGIVLAIAGLLPLAFALDVPVNNWASALPPGIERKDFTQFFRSGGYLPMWLGLAAAIALEDRRRAGRWSSASARRGIALAIAVVSAGIVAECVKLLCRRERPSLSEGAWYSFRPSWDRPFSTGGLAMPSSHALIAFAGTFMLSRYYPAARPVFVLFALGTAVSRVYVGAHYVSDVYVSMLLGWGIAAVVVARVNGPHHKCRPLSSTIDFPSRFSAHAKDSSLRRRNERQPHADHDEGNPQPAPPTGAFVQEQDGQQNGNGHAELVDRRDAPDLRQGERLEVEKP